MTAPLRYVALGDSYTIGTALDDPADRWPDQLVRALGGDPPALDLIANLAVNGYTSDDVNGFEIPTFRTLVPEFVTLLVGVNDVVRGVPAEDYRRNLRWILNDVLELVPAGWVVTVSTPDYTVTPRGGDYGDPDQQAAAIRRSNDVLREMSAQRGIAFVDIHDLSLRAATDRSLVADDGLHPSGAQYALWVERIAPVVAHLLGRTATPGR